MIGGILDLVLDPPRGSLPVQLMIIGLGVLLAGGVVRALQPMANRRSILVGGTLLATGYWFTVISVIRGTYGLYAAYLYLLFRAVEGAAAAHFYHKVLDILRGKSAPGGTKIRAYALHIGAVFSVILTGSGIILYRLEGGAVGLFDGSIRLTYTIVLLVVTLLGVWWRIQPLRNEYRIPTLLGFTACVTGAELYGYASVELNISVLLAGSLTQVFGFWLAVVIWLFRGHWLT